MNSSYIVEGFVVKPCTSSTVDDIVYKNRGRVVVKNIIINQTNSDISARMPNKQSIMLRKRPGRNSEKNVIVIIAICQYDHLNNLIGEDQIKYTINESELHDQGILVDQSILIYFSKNEAIAAHPFDIEEYGEALERAIKESEETNTIYIAANDPTGQNKSLYIQLLGERIEVKCTSLPAKNPTLHINLKGRYDVHCILNFDISKLFEERYLILKSSSGDHKIPIGITKRDLIAAIDADTLENITNAHENHSVTVSKSMENLKKEHNLVVKQLNHVIEEKNAEIVKLKTENARQQALIDSYVQKEKSKIVHDTLDYKKEEQQHKSTRASIAADGEATKFIGSAAKVGLGIAAGAAAVVLAPKLLLAGLIGLFI